MMAPKPAPPAPSTHGGPRTCPPPTPPTNGGPDTPARACSGMHDTDCGQYVCSCVCDQYLHAGERVVSIMHHAHAACVGPATATVLKKATHSEEHVSNQRRTGKTQSLGPQQQKKRKAKNMKLKLLVPQHRHRLALWAGHPPSHCVV